MRYNHRYHQLIRGTKRSRRFRVAGLVYLAIAIATMVAVFHTPLNGGEFLTGFVSSLFRVTIAYLVSLVLAVGLGLLTVSSPAAEAILLPIMDLAQSFPTFALLPVLVFYFGANSLSVVVILVVAMIWPMMFAVIGGVKDEHQDQAEAASIFGARGWRRFIYYRLPMLRPHIITGSIVSWGQAWDTIVGAEIIARVQGAGHYLGSLGHGGHASLLMLGILIYLLLIFSLNQLIWLPLLHRYTRYQND